MADHMNDCLANPIQCMEAGTRINLRPRKFYPDENNAQTVSLPNGIKIPILHNGPLPYIPVRRPTAIELDTCENVDITEHNNWDPYSSVH